MRSVAERPLARFLRPLVLACLAALVDGCGAPEPTPEAVAEATVEPQPKPVPAVVERRAGRRAKRASHTVVAKARAALRGGGSQHRCGPYPLWTDVTAPTLLAVCERIGARLDAVYGARYSVTPVGEPQETIFLFAHGGGFRAFMAEEGAVRAGYAGVARGTKGFVALSADGLALETVAATLAHELTHLVNRRALGSDLPRWLGEGLADGIGDSAGAGGLGELRGLSGVEDEARRLAWGYGEGKVGSAARLVALGRGEFDREVVSFDYEQSALLVRYLLLDARLGGSLRDYLRQLAAGKRYSASALQATLGVSWSTLDRRLRTWVLAGARGHG